MGGTFINTYWWSVLPLMIAFVADKIFGDPKYMLHPIVWFGKLIEKGEKVLNKGNIRFTKGMILTVTLTTGTFVSTWLIISLANIISIYLSQLLICILIFYCLAGTTLIREVKTTFFKLNDSIESGRKQLSRIVGRDTSQLNEQEIRIAALETLAENLSDGVIAPLFWYMLLGVEGMMTYKMINTLDSMIGYKSQRYKKFGCFAARLDDVVNYLPARLTAIIMILVCGKLHLFSFIIKYGNKHLSPNSGYPEAALAGILNCQFGGTHMYNNEKVYKPYIGYNKRKINNRDLKLSVRINQLTEITMIIIILLTKLCSI